MRINKKVAGMVTVGGLAATALTVTLTAGSAQAGQTSCQFRQHACVGVFNETVAPFIVNSVRVNGQCLLNAVPGFRTYPHVGVNYSGTPRVRVYDGYHCEGNGEVTGSVRTWWTGTDGENTRTLFIANSN